MVWDNFESALPQFNDGAAGPYEELVQAISDSATS
jgi:hypothetical protein